MEVTLAEGQCLLFIRNTQVVPVPEVYGCCKNHDQVFIYMELVDGIRLEKSWDTITEGEKASIFQQLHDMVDALHGIKQNSWPPFIGKFNFIIQRLSNSQTRSCWQVTSIIHHFYG
jgi:aminoglycoside phosphotransferase (APT) family kinase protein